MNNDEDVAVEGAQTQVARHKRPEGNPNLVMVMLLPMSLHHALIRQSLAPLRLVAAEG